MMRPNNREHPQRLRHVSDHKLLADLDKLVAQSNAVTSLVVLHIAEVDRRRLHAHGAYSSTFDYCVRKLGLSEAATCQRIAVARKAREFPAMFDLLERGEIHLAGLSLLAKHLTPSNHQELLRAARRKSKRDIEKLLAERFPKPDVPERIRKLPERTGTLGRAAAFARDTSSDASNTTPADPSPGSTPRGVPPSMQRRAEKLEPLAPARYKIQLTADQELHDKIERARELRAHKDPRGDLADLFDEALGLLIDKLERQKFGKLKPRPKKAVTGNSADTASRGARTSRHVPAATRREVSERDGCQCTFVGDDGARCPARARLEFDHVKSFARGGPTTADNLRLRCRAHNQMAAERELGREYVRKKIAASRGQLRDVWGDPWATEQPVGSSAESVRSSSYLARARWEDCSFVAFGRRLGQRLAERSPHRVVDS